MASIQYVPNGRDLFVCTVSASNGSVMVLKGGVDSSERDVSGERGLTGNPALVLNAWAFAENEALRRRSRSDEKRKGYQSQAASHSEEARAISEMAIRRGPRTRIGWCSACFHRTTHHEVVGRELPPAYLCGSCGSPTSPCAAPRCGNMANRGLGRARVPRYCAEHRHDLPGFAKVDQRIKTIDLYQQVLNYDKKNLAHATKVVGGVAAAAIVVAPAAFLAAPAIGGAIGGSAIGGGLSGAAAVSHGLAMVGGGSLAAGGMGMAGGTAVITAVGAGLGGALGATTASAYVRSDHSFRIQKLRDGEGPAVLLASGFLTDGDTGWGSWRKIIDQRYPESPVYRVHWGSKELKNLGSLAAIGVGKVAAAKWVAGLAARGSLRAAAKVPYLGGLFIASGIIANPWSLAKTRAAMTGAILADLIARTDAEYVLVGHSLGARVMLTAAQALGTRSNRPRLQAVHLLGAAVPAKGDWRTLNDSVLDGAWNYLSAEDWVLKHLYKNAQLGSPAAGVLGLRPECPKIHNRTVTAKVPSHSAYFTGVVLQ